MPKSVLIAATLLGLLSLASGQALASPIVYRYDGLVSGFLQGPAVGAPPVVFPPVTLVEDFSFSLWIEGDTNNVFDGNVPGFGRVYFNDGTQASLSIGDLGTIDLGPTQAQAWRAMNRVKFHSDRLRARFIGTWHTLAGDWDPTSVQLLDDASFVSFSLSFPNDYSFTVTSFSSMQYSASIIPEPNTAILLASGLLSLALMRRRTQ